MIYIFICLFKNKKNLIISFNSLIYDAARRSLQYGGWFKFIFQLAVHIRYVYIDNRFNNDSVKPCT